MKLSVVIPAHNEAQYISSCLESVLNQEVVADEIIIVDNNCTDKTVSIARHYPVKVIHESKQGITHARSCDDQVISKHGLFVSSPDCTRGITRVT